MIKTYLILRLLDIVTTYIMITYFNGLEMNPYMSQVISFGWFYYMLVQYFASIAIMLTLSRYKSVEKLGITVNIISGAVVLNNLFCIGISLFFNYSS